MSGRVRPLSVRYSAAVLAVVIATALRIPLHSLLGESIPFIFFFPAIVFSGWIGGLGPALLATFLGALIAPYFFLEPRFSFALDITDKIKIVFFLTAGIFISLINEAWYRAKQRAEDASESERRQRNLLQITLSSIGDAVIATDALGRVNFMNPIAESLTGWKMEGAEGKLLSEVFNIVHEATRQTVEDPVTKVLRLGTIVGLANHTILLAKDGREIPIDDSGAPINDDEGNTIGVVLVFRDITDRRRAEAILKESEQRFRILADSAPVMIWMSGTDKLCTYFNKGWLDFTGRTMEQEMGNGWAEGVHKDDYERCLNTYTTSFDAREEFEIEYRLRRFDGAYYWIIDKAIPLYTSNGEFAGYIGSCLDITDRKRSEGEREYLLAREKAAREEAEAINRTRDEFLATISHELRTPLNAILGWTGMLRGGRLDEMTKVRALETVERNARSQAQLIEDMLEVSRIVTGKLRLDLRPVELAPIIQQAIEAIRPAADAKGVSLRIMLDANAGLVSGDSNRLQQVVWNLLSNGVKFTPKGGRVDIRLERIDSHVHITVSDTGEGINSAFLPHIFERFRQADGSLSRKHGGLGLGLSIVHHLIELHGGTVEATSNGEGQGSTFLVKLPVIITHAG
jgi:PAS domain S-box-containing protein